jgi:hypothetical protein
LVRLRAALVAGLAAVWAMGGGGCGGAEHPPAADSNLVLEPGEENQKAVLSSQDRSEAVAAMQSATGGPPGNAERPARAAQGVRWSDIPLAVSAACDELGVEMAVVRTIEEPDRFVFELRTIEAWPAGLVIRRGEGGGEVYEIEEVWVGRFPQDPARVKRAEALVKAFKKHLKRLGAQDWFND